MLGKVLVTGGAGCLGSHIVELLHQKRKELGVSEIVVLDLLDRPRLATDEDAARLRSMCSKWIKGSITDAKVVADAVQGCTTVFHTASMVDLGFARPELLYEVNVKGTELIVKTCVNEASVKAIVYSSSLDVVVHISDHDDKDGETEDSTSYALDNPKIIDPMQDMYGASKTMAERAVLKANKWDRKDLRTASVRPVGLYGERDSVHLSTVLGAARDMGGLMMFRFGKGDAVFQHVYVTNCAWMHILAAKKLCEGDDKVGGQAFFGIDNTKVNNFFDFFEPYLIAKGYKVPVIRIPHWIAYPLASFIEDVFRTLRKLAPKMFARDSLKFTRRAIQGTCVTAWFNTDKAKRLLNYTPLVDPMEARKRSIEFFARLEKEFPQGKYKYPPGKYDYFDDGKDFRPNGPLYLERCRAKEEEKKHGKRNSLVPKLVILSGLGFAAYVVFGTTHNKLGGPKGESGAKAVQGKLETLVEDIRRIATSSWMS